MRQLYSPDQLPIFNTHPVISYFGMDTIIEVMTSYIIRNGTLDNMAALETELLNIIINDHDKFFSMVEEYLLVT